MIRDVNDDKPLVPNGFAGIAPCAAWGESIQEAAHLLGRSGKLSEVKLKAKELGLLYHRQHNAIRVELARRPGALSVAPTSGGLPFPRHGTFASEFNSSVADVVFGPCRLEGEAPLGMPPDAGRGFVWR